MHTIYDEIFPSFPRLRYAFPAQWTSALQRAVGSGPAERGNKIISQIVEKEQLDTVDTSSLSRVILPRCLLMTTTPIPVPGDLVYYLNDKDWALFAKLLRMTLRWWRPRVCRPLRKFLRRVWLPYYREKRFRHGKLLCRNRKDHAEDVQVTMPYLSTDAFWVAAFEGPYKKESDGSVLVCTKAMGTTVEVIQAYAIFQKDKHAGKEAIAFIIGMCPDVDTLTERIQNLLVIGEMWQTVAWKDAVMGFVSGYVEDTLYHLSHTTSYARICRFLDANPIMAAYVWKSNFATPDARERLGYALNIAQKNMGAFKRASSISELRKWAHMKIVSSRTVYDDLPEEMKRRITKAEKALAKAKAGTPLPGGKCYISSDAIDTAQTQYRNLWKDADRWVAKYRMKAK